MLGDLDPLRAGVHAVEDRMTAPETMFIVEDFEAVGGSFVARVEGVAVSLGERRGAEVFLVVPERRTARCAGSAHDAGDRVFHDLEILGRLEAFAVGRRFVVDEIGLDARHVFVEGVHIDGEVFDDLEAGQRIDDDSFLHERLDLGLAGEAVESVNLHGAGATDAGSAAPPESECAVLLPLDLMQRVEDGHAGVSAYRVFFVAGLRSFVLRVEAIDFEGDLHLSVKVRKLESRVGRASSPSICPDTSFAFNNANDSPMTDFRSLGTQTATILNDSRG